MMLSTLLILAVRSTQEAGCMSYMNLVYGLVRHESLVAQWSEHLTGVWKVIGLIPVGDSEFFLCPTLAI